MPHKHVETITTGGDSQAQQTLALKPGMWTDNQRRRGATLALERVEQLSKVGMR
ncbi:hypothetical protein ACFYYB_33925 [Streptomyces sp. NPDC002886]|uniref:hypothetical protein n=1 Tax=Streptomyces sp. NPDC002886 TaxID=3364667 RepID=UPI0036AB75FE